MQMKGNQACFMPGGHTGSHKGVHMPHHNAAPPCLTPEESFQVQVVFLCSGKYLVPAWARCYDDTFTIVASHVWVSTPPAYLWSVSQIEIPQLLVYWMLTSDSGPSGLQYIVVLCRSSLGRFSVYSFWPVFKSYNYMLFLITSLLYQHSAGFHLHLQSFSPILTLTTLIYLVHEWVYGEGLKPIFDRMVFN